MRWTRRRPEALPTRLRVGDFVGLALLGPRGRPGRAVLSATGVALGVATVVAVLGISASSRQQLLAQIDTLGTNLLTVTPNAVLGQAAPTLPRPSAAMVRRVGPVRSVSAIGGVDANVYRSDRIPTVDTSAISAYWADPSLLSSVEGRIVRGRFLDSVTARFPTVVLGSAAASALGVDRADGTVEIWLGNRPLSVIGILAPLALAPELDRSVLVGLPAAQRLFRASPDPVELYVRADPTQVAAVAGVLGATSEPAAPQDVSVGDPADALAARADAAGAFSGLLVALGGVALLVGGVGIANVMVIGILERRGEIGLRRAIGARRAHVAAQFLGESALLALAGGVSGALLGAAATTLYAATRGWRAAVPPADLAGAVAVALVVGTLAGLYPAARAARLAPAEALRAV